MPLSVGDKLGPYEILAPLGAGGMGEVYRASDSRLRRTVAIKVLPHDKVADPERKRRFLQEARAASTLNHPNIVTLYDIANDAGIDYLVMEYVPGKSLDKIITPEGLPMADFIGYGVQIAGALAAAHAAGIVHRDIKPANLIVTSDGHVKVLDFGLAKLEDPAPSPADETRTIETALTKAGMVMGTVAYISPEQARAEAVDARADLFSFGVVLYEMATGHRPFLKPWDWSTPPEGSLDPSLRRIVFKLLEVKPELRYQRAADVATDLKALHTSESRLASRPLWFAAAAALAIVSIAAAAFVYLRPHPPASRDQWIQLTRFPDSVSQPALSPDGRMLTFVRGPETFEGPGQVYVKLLPDGEPVQLTHDARNKMSPVFSPDGSRIAYTVGGWDTWAVPVVSGEPRLWLKNASGLLWLDRQKLLYSEQTHPEINNHMGIFTAEESLAGKRSVYLPPVGGMAHRSYPSPDGKSALVVEMQTGAWGPCRLLPLDGSSAGRTVGPPGAKCTFAGWSPDGKWMYLSSSAGDSFHTWRQRYPDGQPEQVTSGPTEEEGIAITSDGRAFITSVALKQSVVWVHDEKGERPISVEGYSFDPKITPDGKKLCYRILKGGLTTFDRSEMRVVELDTGHNDPLFPGLEITGEVGRAYDISADGREAVAGVQGTDGKQHLWIAALDRLSPPRQIPGVEGQTPFFGKDGEVFFRGDEAGPKYVYAVREDGSGLRKVSDTASGLLQGVSPDGQWVVAGVRQDDGPKILAFPAAGGPPVQVVSAKATTVQHLAWSPDGKLIFFSETTQATATHIVGKTFIVPLVKGETFPKTPYTSLADLAKQPGVRVIDAYDTAPGPTPDVYAFSRAAVQRNLYRIPLP